MERSVASELLLNWTYEQGRTPETGGLDLKERGRQCSQSRFLLFSSHSPWSLSCHTRCRPVEPPLTSRTKATGRRSSELLLQQEPPPADPLPFSWPYDNP